MSPATKYRGAVLGSAALVLAVLASAPAFAATPINETRPLDADGTLEIANLKGSIEVRAWDRPEVRIQGSLGEGVEKLEIDGDRQRLVVRVKYPNGGGIGLFGRGDRSEPTELRLMVPVRADLDIDSVSADIDVSGVAPRGLSIDSVSGDITVAGAPREVDIDSVSGDLRLTLNSRDVSIESVSGDVDLRGRLDGQIEVETVSGRIGIDVLEVRVRELSAASVSGNMRIATALAAQAEISLESVSGDLELSVPRDLSATVRGESFSGTLRAPGARINTARHGPGSDFEHRYGGGDGRISIETFSGNAALRMD